MSFLTFNGLTKTFPGVRALGDVSFGVDAGSVHALCGENGAGKSTLLKILSGVYQPNEGDLSIGGVRSSYKDARAALEAGVSVIYQELNSIRELSVAENIFIGHLPKRFGIVNKRELYARTREALSEVGMDIDPREKLGRLSLAQMQMVEIAKALSHHAKVIAFDEPTSSLSSRETDKLFEIIERLKGEGKAILYVSHRMDEILGICDACTVLRDGQHVKTFASLDGVEQDDIIRNMVGRDIEDIFGYEPREIGGEGLSVTEVEGFGLAEPVSLEVKKGEVVGVFGLVGAGRSELMKAIYSTQGDVAVGGVRVKGAGPKASVRAGLVFCPEDRKHEGIIPLMSVGENTNLSVRNLFARLGILNGKRERLNAEEFVGKLKVKTPTLGTPIRNLSGGNQQKVILARWLSENVKAIMLDEPTRGIDVGAKSEIYGIIRKLAEDGVAVLFVSSEMPEVMGVSDRIMVMCEGRVTGQLSRKEATQEKLLELALPHGEREVVA